MNLHILISLGLLFWVGGVWSTPLLGAKECSWGPSYWCQNITSAHSCNAVKHCIQTVWEKQEVTPDNDSICKICKDMVGQARDQLESNETQEEIKQVFEGSCHLIPIKVIQKECDRLADDFIPDLIETLASQMNPDIVCSVAGLCNNAHIDKLLEEHAKESHTKPAVSIETSEKDVRSKDCKNCFKVADLMEENLSNLDKSVFMEKLVRLCGRMGSYSDGCSHLVVKYIEDIYNRVKTEFKASSVCHLAGVCNNLYHQHKTGSAIEVIPHGSTGVQRIDDDLPCDLCSQLVGHLRDLLIANTTENEFEKVLEGICKQSKSFKSECLSIVESYTPVIYNFLIHQLNGTELCEIAGLCPGPGLENDAPLFALVPPETASKAEKIIKKPQLEILSDIEIQNAQLPIDRIMPLSILGPENSKACTLCEYVLHYLQVEISDSKNEDEIKKAVESVCEKLPKTLTGQCEGFIETYGDAVIALLVQEIDPTQICPALSLCPRQDVKDVEVLIHESYNDKPNCPLCLFAVKQLEDLVKEEKTEENIKKALDTLCSHLSKNLAQQCDDFVATYSKELIEMLLADLNPQEVCVYLKLCDPKNSGVEINEHRVPQVDSVSVLSHVEGHYGEILTNEIPDDTVEGRSLPRAGAECILCEFVMKEVDNALKNRGNEEEIKHVVHGICNFMPKDISTECNQFVNQYADTVIQLLVNLMEPKDICRMILNCGQPKHMQTEAINGGPVCVACKLAMKAISKQLNGTVTPESVEKVVHGICNHIPESSKKECDEFIKKYADPVIELIVGNTSPETVCDILLICASQTSSLKSHVSECAVCQGGVEALKILIDNPKVDHEIDHMLRKACAALPSREIEKCRELMSVYGKSIVHLLEQFVQPRMVCRKIGLCYGQMGISIQKRALLGAEKCTWGPSYWCDNLENAKECNSIEHCQKNVWKGEKPKVKRDAPGSHHCTWGPSYWCKSEENAKECGGIEHCQKNVWKGERPKVKRDLPGSNHCTWGPSYWCESEENAKECGGIEHCQKNVWKGEKPKVKRDVPGSNPCTHGPAYWCKSEENAKECGGTEHCQKNVWKGEKPKQRRELYGSKPCTYGPSYWCQSEANAKECGAIKHCQENVWNKGS